MERRKQGIELYEPDGDTWRLVVPEETTLTGHTHVKFVLFHTEGTVVAGLFVGREHIAAARSVLKKVIGARLSRLLGGGCLNHVSADFDSHSLAKEQLPAKPEDPQEEREMRALVHNTAGPLIFGKKFRKRM